MDEGKIGWWVGMLFDEIDIDKDIEFIDGECYLVCIIWIFVGYFVSFVLGDLCFLYWMGMICIE